MNTFTCLFCDITMPVTYDTHRSYAPSFNGSDRPGITGFITNEDLSDMIQIDFYKCPNCNNTSISISGTGEQVEGRFLNFNPISNAKQFPHYIPIAIRTDYEEACAIVNLSPKASATLSRRCLQGMIHDYWGIKLKNLNHEITALKDKVPPDLWQSIDALRELGNIGAHMEKDTSLIIDIDPTEASALVQLIELLMDGWYITRHKRKQLFSSISTTNTEKQNLRPKKG